MNSIKIILISIASIIGLFPGSLWSAQAKLHASAGAKPALAITKLDYSPNKAFDELVGASTDTEVKTCAAALCIQHLIPAEMTEDQLKTKFKDNAFRCQLLAHLKAHLDT